MCPVLRESLEARGWSPNQAFAAGGVTAGMLASVLTHPAGEHMLAAHVLLQPQSPQCTLGLSLRHRYAAGLLTWVLTAQQVDCVASRSAACC